MDESTTGKRLRKAIEEGPRGFSVRGFQREMEARLKDTDVRGYTYPSINSYLHGETSPSVAFLEQAADVLGVRLAYLAAGDGPMTEGIDPDALETKVLRGLGVGADSGHHPWADPLAEARRRFEPDKVEFPLDEARDVTQEIIRALRGPLDALEIAPERMGWDSLNDYIFSMIPVLSTLAPEYERQKPYSPEALLEGTRRDLEQAREDDLSPETIQRLEEQVQRLEERVEDEANDAPREEEDES